MSNNMEKEKRQASAAKRWCYTKFNDKNLFPIELCEYRVEGVEICPETKKKHWQCFVILKEKVRFTAIKSRDKDLGGTDCHYEVAKATPYLAAMYCMKGDQSHQEWSDLNVKGPNFGLNAQFVEHGTRPTPPKEKSKSELGMR